MASFKEIKDKVINGGGLFTFLRSSMSSQIASWIDMGTRFIFFSFILASLEPFYRSNLSVAIGAIIGGVVNCCINYRFTFHASGQNVKAVIVKYFLVWVGSLLLNMYGTTFLQLALSKWDWLQSKFTPRRAVCSYNSHCFAYSVAGMELRATAQLRIPPIAV